MKDLRQQLAELLRDRTCLIGLGNIDCGDDGFGIRLAEQLLAAGVADVVVAGTTPERCVGRLADQGFDQFVFLDAVEFGASPGSVVLLDAREISARYPQISTHKISLGVLAEWIQASGRTQVSLLGVQPQSMRPEPTLTPTVNATLDLLRTLLLELSRGKKHIEAAALGRGPQPARFWRDGVVSCPAERSSAAVGVREESAIPI